MVENIIVIVALVGIAFISAIWISDQIKSNWVAETIGAVFVLLSVGMFYLIEVLLPGSDGKFVRFCAQFILVVVGTKLLCVTLHEKLSPAWTVVVASLAFSAGFMLAAIGYKSDSKLLNELYTQFVYVLAGVGSTLFAARMSKRSHTAAENLQRVSTHRPRGGAQASSVNLSGKLAGSETKVGVRVGNLFEQTGLIVIGVNEYFDTQVGELVAPTSIHGAFLSQFARDDTKGLDHEISVELAKFKFESEVVTSKRVGNKARYPLGATAAVSRSGKSFLLLAVTHTDIQTCKASVDFVEFLATLDKLWTRVRETHNQRTVHIPLIGGGLARLNLPPKDLLWLILLSFKLADRKEPVCPCLSILLSEGAAAELEGFEADLQRVLKDGV